MLVELGALLIGISLLGRLALRLGLSPIPFYLLAGLLLGVFGEEPLTFSREVVEVGAQIGLVLLLFMLGLEYAGHELGASLRGSVPAAGFDFIVNFAPGMAAGLLLGWGPVAGFALGGVTYISSSALVAKVIDDFGRRQAAETPVVLSLLVIEDLAMAAYLPLLGVVVAGAGLGETARTLLGAMVFAGVALALAVRWGHHVTRTLSPRSEEVFLLTIFGFALVVAGVAEEVLASAAIGAFLAGIAVSGPAVDRARGLLTPLRDVFAAAFFVFFGLQVDAGEIAEVLLAATGLAVVASATKWWTGWRAAGRAGVDPAGRRRAGAALIARGEFSIVVAGIAVAGGAEPALGALAGAFVLLTALLGSVLSRSTAGGPGAGTAAPPADAGAAMEGDRASPR